MLVHQALQRMLRYLEGLVRVEDVPGNVVQMREEPRVEVIGVISRLMRSAHILDQVNQGTFSVPRTRSRSPQKDWSYRPIMVPAKAACQT